MRLAILVTASLWVLTGSARADYIDLKHAGTLRSSPNASSDAVAELSPPARLLLLSSTQDHGYYHVRVVPTGEEGFIYRTYGRRMAGNPPATSAPSGAGSLKNPTVDEFAIPGAPLWGKPTKTDGCHSLNGLQDANCTPGDILANEDEKLVCSTEFHTKAVRDKTTTAAQKNHVYDMYAIPHPAHNSGPTQVCEIDHLVSLELGGADTMANLWPQCSPGYQNWQGPGFHDKDGFENYLWFHVCVNQDVSLKDAQIQIATNWRKYWELAGKPECRNRQKCE